MRDSLFSPSVQSVLLHPIYLPISSSSHFLPPLTKKYLFFRERNFSILLPFCVISALPLFSIFISLHSYLLLLVFILLPLFLLPLFFSRCRRYHSFSPFSYPSPPLPLIYSSFCTFSSSFSSSPRSVISCGFFFNAHPPFPSLVFPVFPLFSSSMKLRGISCRLSSRWRVGPLS